MLRVADSAWFDLVFGVGATVGAALELATQFGSNGRVERPTLGFGTLGKQAVPFTTEGWREGACAAGGVDIPKGVGATSDPGNSLAFRSCTFVGQSRAHSLLSSNDDICGADSPETSATIADAAVPAADLFRQSNGHHADLDQIELG